MTRIRTKFTINIEELRLFQKIQTNFKHISKNVQIRTIDKNLKQSTYSVLLDDGDDIFKKVSDDDILEKTWMVIRILVVPRTC